MGLVTSAGCDELLVEFEPVLQFSLRPRRLELRGRKLVISDGNEETIILRTRSILIEDGGELHIGSEDCPFQNDVTIILYG
eukprot:g35840.t1